MKLNFFSTAFKKTLKQYDITGKKLSDVSGISQNHISTFKNGENVSIETLSTIMQAMETLERGSVKYFMSLVSETVSPTTPQMSYKASLETLVEAATDEEVEAVMLAIACRWRVKNGTKELCA